MAVRNWDNREIWRSPSVAPVRGRVNASRVLFQQTARSTVFRASLLTSDRLLLESNALPKIVPLRNVGAVGWLSERRVAVTRLIGACLMRNQCFSDAARCRVQAKQFAGRPEETFLLRLASEFEALGQPSVMAGLRVKALR